jgi:hypothetical protein
MKAGKFGPSGATPPFETAARLLNKYIEILLNT